MRTRPSSIPGGSIRGVVRVNGIALLLAIVVVGVATGAGFYRCKRVEMDARVAQELAQVPSTPEERATLWLRLSGPQIHHRLAVVGRFTPEMPWLVTHAIARPDGLPPELWGIECSTLPKDLAHLEGMHIVVDLPKPRALGRATLEGARSDRVPLYAPEASPDSASRLAELARYLLEGIPGALERDVPGATLEFRVAP